MTLFRFQHLHVENFRCFEELHLDLDDDLTVLFAENGGGKTALLTALAMGVGVFQRGTPKMLKLDARRDPRMVTLDERGRREPAGPCTMTWTADVGGTDSVEWSTTVNPASSRRTSRHRPILDAIEKIRVPGDRWPLFAWYGVDRMRPGRPRKGGPKPTHDRWEAYASSLDSTLTDAPLLEWLMTEILGERVMDEQGRLRSHLVVIRADEILSRNGLHELRLQDGETLRIFVAVSGG